MQFNGPENGRKSVGRSYCVNCYHEELIRVDIVHSSTPVAVTLNLDGEIPREVERKAAEVKGRKRHRRSEGAAVVEGAAGVVVTR